jgi:hypothetical protein
MMLMRYLVAFFMLTASAAVLADALDVNLNNNTAQFQYGTASGFAAQGKADLHAGILYNNVNSVLINAGIMVANNMEGVPGLSIGVGMEGLIATIKDNSQLKSNATALAVDGSVRYSPPGASQLGLVGELHYAPRILTFGDAIRYAQAAARVEFELSPQAMVYVGYRRVSFGIKNAPAAVLDNGGLVGFKFAF